MTSTQAMPRVSAEKARQLVVQHGGITPAARASNIPYGNLYRAYNAYMSEDNSHKVCVFSDTHVQLGVCNKHLTWIGKWLKDANPAFIIQNGDFGDFPSMCGHEPNETAKGKLKPSLKRDLDYFEECVQIISKASGRSDIVFVEGNHEGPRILKYEDFHPETQGMLFSRYEEILRNGKWQRIPYGRHYNLLGVDFVHSPMNGKSQPTGGMLAVKNVAQKSIKDTVFSHTHKGGVHIEAKFGNDEHTTALNTGHTMPIGYVPDYASNGMRGWVSGVVELVIQHGKIRDHSFISMETLRDRYDQ